uniref:Uncharacterized protein n=1 Tax=Cyprinus carpio TaxID=7962 RepID=A0A8C2HM50_CYPCA
ICFESRECEDTKQSNRLSHGNHKEDSPFLSSPDSASKRNDYYDKNLALFEVHF